MADQKFIFVGDRGSIGTLALEYGTSFDADPDWVRGQAFPAVPIDSLHVGHTKIEALVALNTFMNEMRQEAGGVERVTDTALPDQSQEKE